MLGALALIPFVGYLQAVALPVLHCPVNAEKSLAEVRRVVAERDYGFAHLALADGVLVGPQPREGELHRAL